MQQPEEQHRLSLLIRRLRDAVEDTLGENLTGIYVHGSAAMGCFSWNTGGVDCLVVTDEPLGRSAKTAMIDTCLALQPLCPPKGLELSVVTKETCRNPQRNPSFEFHFSPLYAEAYARDAQEQLLRMPATDLDLIAHFAMVRSRGMALLSSCKAGIYTNSTAMDTGQYTGGPDRCSQIHGRSAGLLYTEFLPCPGLP